MKKITKKIKWTQAPHWTVQRKRQVWTASDTCEKSEEQPPPIAHHSCTPVHPIASYSIVPSWAWIKGLDMKGIVLHCRWPIINRKQFICLKFPTCSFCFNVLVLYQIKPAPLKRLFAKPGTGPGLGNKTEIRWGRLILRQPSNITRAAQERGEIALGILPRR